MKLMKLFLSIFIMASVMLNLTNTGFAQIEERDFIGEYRFGDNESRAEAKQHALEDALRKVSEYVGVYIQSSSEAINFKITSDQVKIASEAFVRIIEHPVEFIENGITCRIRITAIIDWDSINKFLRDGQTNVLNAPKSKKIPGVEEYNGHYYKLYNDSIDWLKASQRCKELGGYLVSITSKEEQATVQKIMFLQGKKNYYWTGGFRISIDAWQWINKEAFTYTNWDTGEPDNELGNGYILVIYGAGVWGDCPREGINHIPSLDFFNLNNSGFICEWDSYDDIKDPENI